VIYLDTSVLLVYTLTQSIEVERFRDVSRLFSKIAAGAISAATSFYALHEVYVFALDNAPDQKMGYEFGKLGLQEILTTSLRILPFVSRADRTRLARRFSALRDQSDVPHAISAFVAKCEAVVAYDDHFKAVAEIIPYKNPSDYL
jgi:predicted nucleic acid-binding protein